MPRLRGYSLTAPLAEPERSEDYITLGSGLTTSLACDSLMPSLLPEKPKAAELVSVHISVFIS
jgi:hypothetical protein